MDEPLSNLDALLRLQTRTQLKRLHDELGTTFVFVTHDQEEAMTLGTRIAVLKDGRLMQFDTPHTIYHRPATRFVAEFIGRPAMNTIDGRIVDGTFESGQFALPVAGHADGPAALGIRPEHIGFQRAAGPGTIRFHLEVVEIVEPDMLMFVECGDVHLVVRGEAAPEGLAHGAEVHLSFPEERLHLFSADDGARLA